MHVRALDKLVAAVTGPGAPLGKQAMSCIDILLKWVTLRFCDSNTSVLLKCVQFIQVPISQLSFP